MQSDVRLCRVVVSGVPREMTPSELTVSIATFLQQTLALESPPNHAITNVQYLMLTSAGRSAMVEFMSAEFAFFTLTTSIGNFILRRPRDFDISSEIQLDQTVLRQCLLQQLAATATATLAPSSVVTISNFPPHWSESVVHDLLSQFGRLKSLSLEKIGNSFSGRGLAEYELFADGLFAVAVLPDLIGSDSLRLELGSAAAAAATAAAPAAQPGGCQFPISARVLGNASFARQLQFAREIGNRPSPVVVLLNVFPPGGGAADVRSLVEEISDISVRFGAVASVGAEDRKVFVHFAELVHARKFQLHMNGRLVDGQRSVCAGFYPLDRFLSRRFSLFV